jgi:DNA-binding transcriptional LysR family regulator
MLDGLTLDQMRTFVAVADTGSFRSAAVRLSRVQSAVSHAIANLEAELGVALFDRSGHRPMLTPEGKALLANVRDILLRVDVVRARARGMGEGVELELPVVIDTLFPMATVGTALLAMRRIYPSVAIRVAVEPLGGPLAALLDKQAAFAITVGGDFRDRRVGFEAICPIETIAVVSVAHPLARHVSPDELGLPDLADHLQIVLADRTTLSEGRDFNVLSPQTCRVSGQDTKHALILAGLGWGRLPTWQVLRDLHEGRLVPIDSRLLGRDARLHSEAYLGHRLDEPLGPAASVFRRELAAAIAEGVQM